MKITVYVIMVLGLAMLVLLSVPVARAQSPTPTVSPTSMTPVPPGLVVTVTPRPGSDDIDVTCPLATPIGWLTVTPSWMWWMYCEHCVAGISTATAVSTPTPYVTAVPADYQIFADGSCRGNYYHSVYNLATDNGYQTWGQYAIRSPSCGYVAGVRSVYARVTVDYTYTSVWSVQGYSTELVYVIREPSVREIVIPVDSVQSPAGGRVTVSGTYVYEGVIPLDYWSSQMGFGSRPARAGELLTASVTVDMWVDGLPVSTPTPVMSYCSYVEPDNSSVSWAGVEIGASYCFQIPAMDLSVPFLPAGGFPGALICMHDLRVADLEMFGTLVSLNKVFILLYTSALLLFFLRV